MLQSLKDKLTPKNKIVRFFQQGKLSEEEFKREMEKADMIERNMTDKEIENLRDGKSMLEKTGFPDDRENEEDERFVEKADWEQKRDYEEANM